VIRIPFIQKLKAKFKNQGNSLESDKLYVSDTYIRSNKYLFDLKEDTTNGPFSSCTRSLLVDSILTNLEIKYIYQSKKISIKGLPLIINAKIFEESFLLHDQTSHKYFTKIINNFKWENLEYTQSSIDYLVQNMKKFSMTGYSDMRAYLQDNWASLGNLFKFQPLGSIRDYFGEQNAIYFGFVGSFITMLWIPALVGIVFFVLGLSFYYRQVKDTFK